MKVEKYVHFFIIFCLLISSALLTAQAVPGILRGQLTDPSGAAITNANVVMTPAVGSPLATQTNGQGAYEFKSLPSGKYTLTVVAQGFALYENDGIVIADQPLRLNVSLLIEVEAQKIQVSEAAPTIDVNPANNAGAIVISGKELEALPDDPDELQADLEALAGPSAGPNGGQMYIDGFTGGQLPPKSSIREIRINQNPFSSEYDKLGYGRIEIFTKPGTDKYHGQFMVNGNDSAFNSHNPFAGAEPGYDSTQYSGNLGGPLGKTASFFFTVERRNINEIAPINAIVSDSTFTTSEPFTESVPNPRQRTNLGPRFDWAITKNNTLTARYQYYRDTETNNGVGQLSLPSQAYYSKSTEQTVQISDAQVIGSKIVNELRFQYNRDQDMQNPQDTNPSVNVLGTFLGGGSSEGTSNDLQNRYELQNYTSLIHGNHILKFGGRFRATRESSDSTSGFNGSFTFANLSAYQAAEQNLQAGNVPLGASQFVQTQGSPNAEVTYYDAGIYLQDDWRIRPNLTLSSGLRFETQNDIHDHGDWAPRFGIAWGIGGRTAPPKVVLRGGFGIFYDRFQSTQILQVERLNGVTQQQFTIANPTCFSGLDVPLSTSILNCGTVSSSTSTIYQTGPRLRAPYTLQGAASAERQLTKSATLSLTYLNSRGFDQFLSINANAPYPGTPCSPNCPFTTGGNIYRYVSEGNFTQNQFIVNSNIRIGSKVQLFTYYTLNYANSDAATANSFASNSYNISQDYGRGSFDTRHRLFLGGSIALPYAFRLSPFMIASSGSPFNITSGTDLNGDSIFNDRPGLVSTATCPTVTQNSSIYCTPLGTFDALGNGKLLPINYGTGPSHFVLNLRLSKTFGFGPKTKGNSMNPGAGGPGGFGGGGGRGGGGPRGPLFGGGGPMGMSSNSDRRYNLTLGVNARNVFNKVNVSNPGGVLGSPLFDVSNSLQGGPFGTASANRRIDLQATFSF